VGVESIMCAYNRLNGQPCCASNDLLNDILRKEWKFTGHIVTDCGAIDDMVTYHKFYENKTEAVTATLKAGTSLDCSGDYQRYLSDALKKGLINEEDINRGLSLLLATQFRLGFYDAPGLVPFSSLGAKDVNTPAHVALAHKAAVQSMVLLKNEKQLLPLNKKNYGSIMVLGPNAGAMDPLVANYHGMAGNMVSFAEGITKAAGPGIAVQYDQGSDFNDTTRFGGIWAAGESDITIAVIGLTPVYEGEEGDAFLAANGGDKLSLDLPAAHIALLRELRKKNKPVIAVVTAGSNVDISAIEPYADAIILAWYPGEQGGNALADIIFGHVSPSGRLPITFYQNFSDLPDYADYSMQGRTYRYFKGDVQYPFGFGLSYTNFQYTWKQKPQENIGKADHIDFSVVVKNTGEYTGDEVIQAYVEFPDAERMPVRELKAFKRVSLLKGAEMEVALRIPVADLQKWDMKEKRWKLYEGEYRVVIGSHSQDRRLESNMHYKASKKK
jgi:beta-glucosidase